MTEYSFFPPPAPVTYRLYLNPRFTIECTGKVPNRFQRWMILRCFGWRVEVV